MKIIRFDGTGGAAGDMMLASLIGLGVEVNALRDDLAKVVPEHFHLSTEAFGSHGVHGLRLSIDCHDHHHHDSDHAHEHHHPEGSHRHGRTYREIRALLDAAPMPEEVRATSHAVFAALAEAEASVHQTSVEDIHFHEVGATDSILDIVGCCWALFKLGVTYIDAAPMPTGVGVFTCAHGTYPIPAPATAELLRAGNLAVAACDEPFELLTPTGAALLGFLPRRPLAGSVKILKTANAFGSRKLLNRPNWLRATLYEVADEVESGADHLLEFVCNLDDATGEEVAYAIEKLWEAEALDVWTVAIGMKKNRPGTQLSVLAAPERKSAILAAFFRHTTTFGVRIHAVERPALEREIVTEETACGPVRVKNGYWQGQLVTRHVEFADRRAIAEREERSLKDI